MSVHRAMWTVWLGHVGAEPGGRCYFVYFVRSPSQVDGVVRLSLRRARWTVLFVYFVGAPSQVDDIHCEYNCCKSLFNLNTFKLMYYYASMAASGGGRYHLDTCWPFWSTTCFRDIQLHHIM